MGSSISKYVKKMNITHNIHTVHTVTTRSSYLPLLESLVENIRTILEHNNHDIKYLRQRIEMSILT